MAVYFKKNHDQILREALAKIERDTQINATNPGSVARAITESITTELGDYYDILNVNLTQSLISTATGSALDKLGSLYNINRKTVGSVARAEQKVGSFYFYIDSTYENPITINAGTRVFTNSTGFVGRQLTFTTANSVVISPGSLRAYVAITPEFSDGVFTAPIDTLTSHNFFAPTNVTLKCTNPKEITATQGYERDTEYRTRIIKGIRVASSGTIEAVRFAGLNISGVRDIRVRQAPYGLGSYELLVVSEQASLVNSVLAQVRIAVDKVRPLGVTMFMRTPVLRPLDMAVSVLSNTVSSPEYTNLAERVRLAVTRYLNTLMPGDTIVYNKLIQSMVDSSGIIKDIQVLRFSPNGVDSIKRNYTPKDYEQIIPGNIQVSVA